MLFYFEIVVILLCTKLAGDISVRLGQPSVLGKLIVGIIIGGATGWLYWKYFGCTGTCTITSKPLNSSLYGGLIGGLLFYTLISFVSKKNHN